MTGAQARPRLRSATTVPAPLSTSFKSMASRITLQVIDPGPSAPQALEAARQVFGRVEAACTRFDPDSPLMRANAAGQAWHRVPPECYLAVAEAARAHRETGGLFDPRVLDSLIALGYDRTLPFAAGRLELVTSAPASPAGPASPASPVGPADPYLPAHSSITQPWRPGLAPRTRSVRLGPRRIDLGGIGKGLAVRLAGLELAGAGRAYLVEAGGDCLLGGDGPFGGGWRVGVEDPSGEPEPVAVLQVSQTGCATSSLRVRSWLLDGDQVHHLIDPRSGRSARGGLRSVTVLAPDPAWAEVWSKALLIVGRERIKAEADERTLAALWVDDQGRVDFTDAMASSVIWETSGGR